LPRRAAAASASASSAGSNIQVAGSESIKTGRAPRCVAGDTLAMKVMVGA
jgi:hypothetical protein